MTRRTLRRCEADPLLAGGAGHLATAAVVVRKLRAINPDCPAADSAAAGRWPRSGPSLWLS